METVRRELAPWLTGRRIVEARRRDAPPGPKYVGLERADGQTIRSVNRRGKFLVMPLSSGDELIVHLGMTGRLTPTDPGSHVRVTAELEGQRPNIIHFRDVRRFGRFLVVPRGDYRILPTLDKMGPEPLSAEFTTDRLAHELQRSRSPVKAWLMSQRPVAGVGNIYVDEALWRARIHPRAPARRVARSRVGPLRDAIVDLLTAAIAAKGTTFSSFRNVAGEEGAYVSQLDVYGRAGEPCRRCGKALTKAVIGQRSTVYCTACQRR